MLFAVLSINGSGNRGGGSERKRESELDTHTRMYIHRMNLASHHITSYTVLFFVSFHFSVFCLRVLSMHRKYSKIKGKHIFMRFFLLHSLILLVIAPFFCSLSSFLLIFIASYRVFCDQVHLLYACFRSKFKPFGNSIECMSLSFALFGEVVTTNKSSLARCVYAWDSFDLENPNTKLHARYVK